MQIGVEPNKSFLKKLMDSPIIWITTTLLSILLAIIPLVPKVNQKIYYVIFSGKILNLEELPPEVSLTYKGNPEPELTYSDIEVWNGGEEAIRKSDFSNSKQIVIVVSDSSQVLDILLKSNSNAYNGLSYKWMPDENIIYINFDYLNSDDYFILRLLHKTEIEITLDAAIIGNTSKSIINKGQFPLGWAIGLLLSIPLSVASIYAIIDKIKEFPEMDCFSERFGLVLGVMFFSIVSVASTFMIFLCLFEVLKYLGR